MLVSCFCVDVWAQRLSLDSCKAKAFRNNAAIKNAVLDVEAAKELKRQAFTKFFPNVTAMAGGYHAVNPLLEYGIDDIESAQARQQLNNLYFEYGASLGLPSSISLCNNGVAIGTTAIQPVFMGGQIVNGNKLADVGVQGAELQVCMAHDEIEQRVEENYWLVVLLYEKKKTLQQALTFLDTLYRDVTVAKVSGLVTQNDLLKVTLKQNEMHSDMLKVDNGIALATMALCQLIGQEYSPEIVLTDSVSADAHAWNGKNQDIRSSVAQRKESELLGLNVEAERLKKKMLVGEALPHLMIGATASYGNPVFDRFSANGLAFATLQVPLTNWWETSHKLKQQEYAIQKAENQRLDLMQKMALEIQQASNNVQESLAQVELMKETVQNAEVNLATSKVNCEAGLIPVSDLLEAQTLYQQVQDQWIEAVIDYTIKCAKLKKIAPNL